MENISELKIQLKSEIETLLKSVAFKENIQNFEPIFNIDEAIRGEGFTGEFFLAGIKNKDTNQIVEVAIKKGVHDPAKRDIPTNKIFCNESYFYSTVFPTLNQLQTEKSLKDPFVNVAKYYCSNLEEYQEAIVFENLKSQGYVLTDKAVLLDDEHTSHIFQTYGKFHALSFALKDQNYEKYEKLVSGLWLEIYNVFVENEGIKNLMVGLFKEICEILDTEEDSKLKKRIEPIANNPNEKLLEETKLKSNYKTSIHGDCWSNNMMFKYSDAGKLESMKLIDFQLVTEANPVHDLSYFFYAGCSKEQFNKLDDFLKIYHNSLSKTLRELGSNPEKVYPLEQLRKDWSKHGLYGVIFSLTVTKVKLMAQNEIMDIVKDNAVGDVFSGMVNANVNRDIFKERIKNILLHALEYNII